MTNDTVSNAEPVVNSVDPLLIEPASLPRMTQVWQPWTMIVPAMLLLPLLCLAFSWQISPSTDEMLLQKRHHHAEAEINSPSSESPKTPAQMDIFVPGEDGKLHRRSIGHELKIKATEMPTDLATISDLQGVAVLEKLFAAAPHYFPKGTEVEELTLEQAESGATIAHLSLNPSFWNSNNWAMDSLPHLTIQAIAHTLAGVYQSETKDYFQILLLRDGQNPGALGQDDVSDPIPVEEGIVSDAPADPFEVLSSSEKWPDAESASDSTARSEKTPPVRVTTP